MPHSCLICRSRAECLFADLDDVWLTELDRMRQISTYPAGVVVFSEGDWPSGVYSICSGRVKLSILSPAGRGIIIGMATAGDILGVRAVLSGRPHDLTVVTLERSQLGFINKNDFLTFLRRNGDLSLKLAEKLSHDLYLAYRDIRSVVLKRSWERLTELLLRFCQRYGQATPNGIELSINLSQEELAKMIGVSRRTLTRALNQLKRRHIIECRRRSIIVRDRVALEKLLPGDRPF